MARGPLARGLLVSFSLVGLALAAYTFYVEKRHEQDESFKAMCDISEKMSCSKAFLSKYGKGFGLVEPLLGKSSPLNLPNPVIGFPFYISHLVIAVYPANHLLYALRLMATVVCCAVCAYLAYVLIYILQDFCIVCITTYLVNGVLLILSYTELLGYQPVKHKAQ